MKEMKKDDLSKLSKSQLIKLLLKQNLEMKKLSTKRNIIQPPLEFRDKPIPIPRKSVKQMVQEYEDNIILPPLEFRDDYKPIPLPRTEKPIPSSRTKIELVDKAMKGYVENYKISIKNEKDPLLQLQNTRKAIEHHIRNLISAVRGVKFVETLKVTFKKIENNEQKIAYFNSQPQTIKNNYDIHDSLQLTKEQILRFWFDHYIR